MTTLARRANLKLRPCLGLDCTKTFLTTPEKRICDRCTEKNNQLLEGGFIGCDIKSHMLEKQNLVQEKT